VGAHGDDKGLIIPPAVAPHQIVIVPILAKGVQEKVLEASRELTSELKKAGFRVHLDHREVRPGSKYFDWEIRGVPLRLELGQRDLDKGVVTFARRDTCEKSEVKREELTEQVKKTLDEISANLESRAREVLEASTSTALTMDDARDAQGVVKGGWCGEERCGLEIEDITEMKVLGTPYIKEEFSGECLVCGRPTDIVAYFAKTY
jgi:prolyl-tRNA synthetase